MTVEVTTSTATRFGNGVTQVFDFGFRVQTAESVKVYSVVDSVKVPLAPGTYVVSINSNGVGGLVTITPAPLAGVRLLISRETNVTQEVSVSAQTRYDPAVAEFVWDKLTMLMQELLLVAAPSEANLLGEFLGPWATAQNYIVGDRVFEGVSGNGYQCILAHTSGVFTDDLAALRWSIYVQRGASGAGTGDMLAAQNLNDLIDKAAARNNLGVTLANLSVTATAAELNILDGVTATAAEINALDGVTAAGTSMIRAASVAAQRTLLGFAQSLSVGSGYVQLPGGVILQWVSTGAAGSGINGVVTFPIAFPTACVSISTQMANTGGDDPVGDNYVAQVRTQTASNFTIRNLGPTARVFLIIAIGY